MKKAQQKKGKKQVQGIEPQASAEISAQAQETPSEISAENGFNPEVQPQTEQEKQLEALNAEVQEIAKGKPLRSVVYSFETRSGGKTGTNLQYYLDCKTNEIVNGQECNFVRPLAAPMEKLPQQQQRSGFAAMGVQPTAMKVKHCPTC